MPDAAQEGWGRAALAALLLALPACAAPQPGVVAGAGPSPFGKPGAAARHAADIPGPACAGEHRALIEEALAVARGRVAQAVRLVAEQPGHPHVARWFGDAPRPVVAERLRRTAAALDRPQDFKTLCNDPPACAAGGARIAYAMPGRRIVGLCPGFFRARMEGFDSRWGVLVHEASHLGAGTQDHAYGPQAALVLAKADAARAAANADTYEYFVESMPD